MSAHLPFKGLNTSTLFIIFFAQPFCSILFTSQISKEGTISSPKVTCLACGEKCNYGHLKYHRENKCKQSTLIVKVMNFRTVCTVLFS